MIGGWADEIGTLKKVKVVLLKDPAKHQLHPTCD